MCKTEALKSAAGAGGPVAALASHDHAGGRDGNEVRPKARERRRRQWR